MSKDIEKNQRSQSRVLSPKRIEGIYEAEEVEIQDFHALDFVKSDTVDVQTQQNPKTQEDEDKKQEYEPEAQDRDSVKSADVQEQIVVENDYAEEENDYYYLEAEKESLWERLRRLMKKKHSLLVKKEKNEQIIESEVTKLEIKKEQTNKEKQLLEDQKKT